MKPEQKKSNMYKILLVEDDEIDQLAFRKLVKAEQLPYEYKMAGSLSQAKRFLETGRFDVVIADYLLGDGSAFEVLDISASAPVIFVTGAGSEEVAVKAWRMGAYDYLIKDQRRNYLKTLPITVENAVKYKQAKQMLHLLSGAVRCTDDNVYITDMDDRIVFVNHAFCETYGYNEQEILGKESSMLCKRKQDSRPQREIYQALAGWEVASYHVRKDGSDFPVSLSRSIIHREDLSEVMVVNIARDISEFKLTEKRLAELLQEVESVNQELKDFAYIVSHDLKAPLRGISSIAEWIAADYADRLGSEGKEQIQLLTSRVKRMHNLIDGILQYSRVGRAKWSPEQVNLNDFLPDVIQMVQVPDNINITIDRNMPTVSCDKAHLRQIFGNLLSNAVKYMNKEQGQINIGGIKDNKHCKLWVSDNGSGIDGKDLGRIFKMFERLTPSDEYESTGIGLTIVKKIIETNNGKIWVESEPGNGSTFFFTLPVNKPEPGKVRTAGSRS